jgi:hypothetical protein
MQSLQLSARCFERFHLGHACAIERWTARHCA